MKKNRKKHQIITNGYYDSSQQNIGQEYHGYGKGSSSNGH